MYSLRPLRKRGRQQRKRPKAESVGWNGLVKEGREMTIEKMLIDSDCDGFLINSLLILRIALHNQMGDRSTTMKKTEMKNYLHIMARRHV
uniref:Uncharacterized protein n=1 Tax=Pristionchus pacificus TaxID=54126 RepID=A0A2A6CY71_PRIPA|eukprot:PDM83115.1 hypothetical protein PRIPAC_37508 [Pristionchus pacificus]